MAKAIGTLGTIPTVSMGGRVFTDLTNLKFLFVEASVAPNSIATPKDMATGAAYQVPSGKTFKVLAMNMQSTASGGSYRLSDMGYGTSDVGFESAAMPTGPVSFYALSNFQLIAGDFPAVKEAIANYSAPQNTYLYVTITAGTTPSSMVILGYEE